MANGVKFSPQQAAFIDWAVNGSGSCVLEAVAGAGKTTTLIEAAEKMPGEVAILAYNKKIAEEIKEKLKKRGIDWKKAEAGTVHSFGYRALCKRWTHLKSREAISSYKVANWLEKEGDKDLEDFWPKIATLVGLAKQRALGVLGRISDQSLWGEIIDHFDLFDDLDEDSTVPISAIIGQAQAALEASNANTEVIDYDDMVYLPLVHKLRFWQKDVVMVDEAQDTNPARRALVRALVKKGGRVIAVGDRHQAIYGFTGADSDSLDLIKQDFNCIQLPLTVTYRCPKAVVAFAQQWVSHIQPAETAPVGSVSSLQIDQLFSREDLNSSSAVLCRNTKPLVELAFAFIRRRIACKVEGRDIGNGLKKLAQRWKLKNLSALESKLDDWVDRERVKNLAKKNESKQQVVEDQADTLKVIIETCRTEGKTTITDLVAAIDKLFSDDVSDAGLLTLSTIHKSKGREWETVFWLDRQGTCPSKYARQAWQQEQEVNLMYVAATRAQSALIEVTKPQGWKPAAQKEG